MKFMNLHEFSLNSEGSMNLDPWKMSGQQKVIPRTARALLAVKNLVRASKSHCSHSYQCR